MVTQRDGSTKFISDASSMGFHDICCQLGSPVPFCRVTLCYIRERRIIEDAVHPWFHAVELFQMCHSSKTWIQVHLSVIYGLQKLHMVDQVVAFCFMC